jgi:hypothetical protein
VAAVDTAVAAVDTAVTAAGATEASNVCLHLQQPLRWQAEQLAKMQAATSANMADAHWERVGTRESQTIVAK